MVVNVKQFFNNFVREDSHYMISAFDFFYETMWTVTHRLFRIFLPSPSPMIIVYFKLCIATEF
jgi:hypothetical protein